MPTSKVLSTRITADHPKGCKATEIFRAVYNNVGLLEKPAQRLNENPNFPRRLWQLIEEESADQVIRETKILKPDGSITFPERNLPVLKSVASTPKRTYGIGRLKKNAYDREIRSNLPKHHLANWEDIASLIEMYPNGKEGYYLLYLEGVG